MLKYCGTAFRAFANRYDLNIFFYEGQRCSQLNGMILVQNIGNFIANLNEPVESVPNTN